MPVSGGRTITLAASAARTADGNGTAQETGGWKSAIILCDITVSGGNAGDTLDVYIDVLGPDGATWLNAGHFTQQAGNGAARKEFMTLDHANPGTAVVNVTSDAAAAAVRPALFGSQMRARWAIVNGGGAHTHTFAVTAFVQ
jgi:hypothetical protein